MEIRLISQFKFYLFMLLTLNFTGNVTPAKILSIEFFSTKSHKLTYLPLLEELGKRGHEVTLVTPIPPFYPTNPMKNVKEILTIDFEKLEKQTAKDLIPLDTKKSGQSGNPFLMVDFFGDICKKSYDLPQVQNLMKEQYDLIILIPNFNECVLGLVHQLKAPVILWSPISIAGFVVEKIGGHFPSSIIPNAFSALPNEMNFYERFLNFGANMAIDALLRFYYEPKMTAVYREKLGDNSIPSVSEILRDQTAMILSNGHFSMHKPKPLFPDVVDVGGIHSRPAKPLPKDLEEFIQKGKDGFIYFSMGSGLKGSDMPDERRKLFLNVFSKLKQQVLWKWETETMEGLELIENVKLSKWLPQQDLLGHPLIKMFITHCGGGSVEEAVYHACPIAGAPMFGDQPLNAKLAKSHGIMVELDWYEMTEESLTSAIQEILNNPDYKRNVQKLSAIYKDQPDDPLHRAAYWAEYVIRHKGAPHLRSAGRKLNYLQYHSYDVTVTYAVLIIVALYLLYKLAKFLFCKIIGFLFRKNKEENARKSKKE